MSWPSMLITVLVQSCTCFVGSLAACFVLGIFAGNQLIQGHRSEGAGFLMLLGMIELTFFIRTTLIVIPHILFLLEKLLLNRCMLPSMVKFLECHLSYVEEIKLVYSLER